MRAIEGMRDGVSVIDERISDTIEDGSHSSAPLAKPEAQLSDKNYLASQVNQLLSNRELSRIIAFLFAGGVSAVVTITVTKLFYDIVLHNIGPLNFLLSALVGTEVGILVNFAINDRLAFRDLSGHTRRFPVRLLRFHVTCATGQSLILLISWMLHDEAKLGTVVAQALPIVLVTGINFALHRFWTYRGSSKH